MSSSWLLPASVLPLLWRALGGCHLSESSRRSRVRPSGQQHTRAVPGTNPNPSPFVFWIITRPSYPFRDSERCMQQVPKLCLPQEPQSRAPRSSRFVFTGSKASPCALCHKRITAILSTEPFKFYCNWFPQLPHNSSILLNQWWVKVAGGNIFWVAAGRAHLKQGSKSWVPHCQRDADKLEEIRKKSHKND